MSLLIVGSVAFDALETPFGKTGKILGGAGTFIALSTSYFCLKPNVISVVGGDFPKEYFDILEKRNIDISGIQIKKDEKTFFWYGKYHTNMNVRDTLITELNVLENFKPEIPASYQDTDFLILGNLSPVVQREVIEGLKKRPKLIAMDTMNFWMDIMWDELMKTISMVDILVINDDEARQMSREHSLVKASEKILKMGPKYLIIKKGEHGALLFGENKIFSTAALPMAEVFDPTGAGDTFLGGFMGHLSKQKDINFENMKSSVVMASVMASFCVEKFGTKKLENLEKNEIENRITKFKDLTHFKM
ncbi:MAG: sugar kinase [Bacteroidetes bacterium 4572_128]|nr:MAG: sugar kinase [Bacteroidetes bacterium 4572_128]